jgi:hypothetical protein
MPAPRLKIAGTSFAGVTAAYRTPICVELYLGLARLQVWKRLGKGPKLWQEDDYPSASRRQTVNFDRSSIP